MAPSARGRAAEAYGLPLPDMIEVRLATRSGRRAASTCATIPPSEAPTTCARAMPSPSMSPATSPAMSASV